MKHFHTRETNCLGCGVKLDAISNVTGENRPDPDDPIACTDCGAIATVDKDGHLCGFTDAQALVFLSDAKWMAMMKRVVKALHFIKSSKN